MPFSYEEYDGDGVNRIFSVPFPYISQQHVTILVGGASVPFTWLSPSQVQAVTAPPVGIRNVRVRRVTPGIIATLSSPSIFRSSTLNTIFRTLLYVSQEGQDAGTEALTSADRANSAIGNLVAAAVSAALSAVGGLINQALSAASSATSAASSATSSASSAASSASAAASSASAAATFNPALYALVGHTHGDASGSAAGFMSATDKTKLDGLSQGFTNANNGLSFSGTTVSMNTNNQGGVGAYAVAMNNTGSMVSGAATAAGSGLLSGIGTNGSTVFGRVGATLTGTWRNVTGTFLNNGEIGLWIRIS